MTSLAIACSLMAFLPSIAEAAKKPSTESLAPAEVEAEIFLKSLYDTAEPSSKCKKCAQAVETSKVSYGKLLVFMSFSIPLESWKELSVSLEKVGGAFVLKGLPGNSFQSFSKKMLELKNAGVNAPVYIDPEIYEKYQVMSVPTVVRVNDKGYDKLSGNIHLESALKILAEQ